MKKKKSISAWGFIMSALGTSIGLGGIWGFPMKMKEYGGTFLIPFLIALIVCAVPLLWVELNLGSKYRKNHVMVFEDLANKPGKFFGYLQSAIVWLLCIFYSVLVAWSLLALIMAFLPGLTEKGYFTKVLLGETTDNPKGFSELGGISTWVLLSLITVWILAGLIVLGGVTTGIDKANKIFVPGLFTLMLIMLIYTVTLNGAGNGLKTMFNFQSAKLLSPTLWKDAFGQAFFMLSTGMGTMIIFASYAPKNQDNCNQSLIIAVGTITVAFITSCTVFAGMGAIANSTNKPIDSLFSKQGPYLIFEVFPQIFTIIAGNSIGLLVLSHILAIFFFLSVFFAGISSLIGMFEAIINPLATEWKIKRWKLITGIISAGLLVDIIFIFNNSGALINGISVWAAGIWLMIIGIFELMGVGGLWKRYPKIKEFNNQKSWFKWDKYWFKLLLLVGIPLLVTINLGFAFYSLAIAENKFIYLTVGTTLGAGGTLLITLFFTYYCDVKNYFKNLKTKKSLKQKTFINETKKVNELNNELEIK